MLLVFPPFAFTTWRQSLQIRVWNQTRAHQDLDRLWANMLKWYLGSVTLAIHYPQFFFTVHRSVSGENNKQCQGQSNINSVQMHFRFEWKDYKPIRGATKNMWLIDSLFHNKQNNSEQHNYTRDDMFHDALDYREHDCTREVLIQSRSVRDCGSFLKSLELIQHYSHCHLVQLEPKDHHPLSMHHKIYNFCENQAGQSGYIKRW